MNILSNPFKLWRQHISDVASASGASINFDQWGIATINADAGRAALFQVVEGLKGGDTVTFSFYAKVEEGDGEFIRAHFDSGDFANALVSQNIDKEGYWSQYTLKYTVPFGNTESRIIASLGIFTGSHPNFSAKFRDPKITVDTASGYQSRYFAGGFVNITANSATINPNFPSRNIKAITKPNSDYMTFSFEFEDKVNGTSGTSSALIRSNPIIITQLDDRHYGFKYTAKTRNITNEGFMVSIVNTATGGIAQTSEFNDTYALYLAITSDL